MVVLLNFIQFFRLLCVTSGYYELLQATTENYRLLQKTTGYYRKLQALKVITDYYRFLNITTC